MLFRSLIGHILIDATGFGIWLSWEISSGVFGLVVGLLLLRTATEDGVFDRALALRFTLAVVIAHALAWLVVAPLGDVLIYSDPANQHWVQGRLAFEAHAVTAAVLGLIILSLYARTRTRTGSLSRER